MKAFPTALETYRTCPRKWSFDQDRELKRQHRKPSIPAFVGSCVHEALEVFFDPARTPMPERTHERLVQLLRDAWAGKLAWGARAEARRQERRQLFGHDRATEAGVGEKAKHMLFRFVRTADLTVVPMTTEQFHEAPIAGGRHVLAGKIDRVDRLADGSLRLVDYKTGRSKSAALLRAEDLQLPAYALILSRKFKAPVARCAMLYLDEDIEVGFEPDEAWLHAREAALIELIDRLEADTTRPPTPGPACSFCDYRAICPEGTAAMEALALPPGDALPF